MEDRARERKERCEGMKDFYCDRTGACCQRGKTGRCALLNDNPEGACAFQKPDREMTNGVHYPRAEPSPFAGLKTEAYPLRPMAEWADEWDSVTTEIMGGKKNE